MTTLKRRIKFYYQTLVPALKNKSALKDFLINLLAKEGKSIKEINYIFCDDQYVLNINLQYLQHDTYTDIITFELNSPTEPVVSEIYISIDRVKENALSLSIPFKTELLRVMIHGALHLAGYKDKSAKQVKMMRTKEDFYLKQFVFHVKL